ncbi:MAG TPA: hypothetical protein VHS31_18480 [Tepidisphaeraceae bacterium]|nr:hypothetical protein [Tepidisphaeraceae bacterium]
MSSSKKQANFAEAQKLLYILKRFGINIGDLHRFRAAKMNGIGRRGSKTTNRPAWMSRS